VGDVFCFTPAIHSLRLGFPQAYLAALVVRYSQDAITGNPDLDEVFIYEKAKHRPDRSRWVSLYKQFRVLQAIKKKRLAIGLRSAFSWSKAWLVYFSEFPWRLGYAPVKKIDTWYRSFYNLAADSRNLEGHEVKRVLGLVQTIGVKAWAERLIVRLPEKERREAEIFLKENEIQPDRLIGFHLSYRRASSRWPAEKWLHWRIFCNGTISPWPDLGPGRPSHR
jgi:ADP-heptose:LPS heptosyltransferase